MANSAVILSLNSQPLALAPSTALLRNAALLRLTTAPSNNTNKPPTFLAFRSSTVFIVFTVCLPIFIDILLYGLIVPVIPFSLTSRVGVPEDGVQHWTAILLACYNAALVIGSPPAGFYANRTSSRRWPFILGLLALCASTLLRCLGKTIAVLVVGRILEGLRAAIVWSVGLALLVDTVGKDVGYAIGYVNIAMAVGLLISSIIGGEVYSVAGYYAVYYVAFAIICCDIALRFALRSPASQGSVDAPTRTPTEEGKSEEAGDHRPHAAECSPPMPPAGDGPGTVPPLSPASHPHRELIRTRRILAVVLGVVIEAAIIFTFDMVVSLYVKGVFALGPVRRPLAVRRRFRSLHPPLVRLRFVTGNTIEHKVLLCAPLVVLGPTPMTVAMTPLMAELTYAIDDREAKQPGIWGEKGVYGFAYGLWAMAFALGGTVRSLMAGYLNDGPGWVTTTWSFAIWRSCTICWHGTA
ncbi:major facilitator superfamily domain-containing protein [Staphylotrichum tortipilum]|uniref:Major facilitator superfamily domain-containing protein n=1 Tax=Staphylotrichum tortipilum TaxID=2831512 RepID=A0AAN6MMG7_9PEZI|nr:major facilitator superfamily domain-containing protein [Staphylotrichum longicolle]